MFLQPMLLRAELEQYPYSLCYIEKEEASLRKWQAYMRVIALTLQVPVDISENEVQDVITGVRAANGISGWKCPASVRAYQIVAAGALVPLYYNKYSEADKESMDEYLQLCLKAAVMGSAIFDKWRLLHSKVGEDGMRRLVDKAMSITKPDGEIVMAALSKITNSRLVKEIRTQKPTMVMLKMAEGEFNSRKCGNCKEEDVSKLKKCARCLVQEYCSKECQKAHWISRHKHECPHFVELTSIKLPRTLASDLDAYHIKFPASKFSV